jgi:hypothetical protein
VRNGLRLVPKLGSVIPPYKAVRFVEHQIPSRTEKLGYDKERANAVDQELNIGSPDLRVVSGSGSAAYIWVSYMM